MFASMCLPYQICSPDWPQTSVMTGHIVTKVVQLSWKEKNHCNTKAEKNVMKNVLDLPCNVEPKFEDPLLTFFFDIITQTAD